MAIEDQSDDDKRGRRQQPRRSSPYDSPTRSFSPPGVLHIPSMAACYCHTHGSWHGIEQ